MFSLDNNYDIDIPNNFFKQIYLNQNKSIIDQINKLKKPQQILDKPIIQKYHYKSDPDDDVQVEKKGFIYKKPNTFIKSMNVTKSYEYPKKVNHYMYDTHIAKSIKSKKSKNSIKSKKSKKSIKSRKSKKSKKSKKSRKSRKSKNRMKGGSTIQDIDVILENAKIEYNKYGHMLSASKTKEKKSLANDIEKIKKIKEQLINFDEEITLKLQNIQLHEYEQKLNELNDYILGYLKLIDDKIKNPDLKTMLKDVLVRKFRIYIVNNLNMPDDIKDNIIKYL